MGVHFRILLEKTEMNKLSFYLFLSIAVLVRGQPVTETEHDIADPKNESGGCNILDLTCGLIIDGAAAVCIEFIEVPPLWAGCVLGIVGIGSNCLDCVCEILHLPAEYCDWSKAQTMIEKHFIASLAKLKIPTEN